jgi:hypothetical protein
MNRPASPDARPRTALRIAVVFLLGACAMATPFTAGRAAARAHRASEPATRAAKIRPKRICHTVRHRRGRRIVLVHQCHTPLRKAEAPARAASVKPPASTAGTAPSPATNPVVMPSVSAWDRPRLVNPTTVMLSDSNRDLKLDQTKDYILQCPAGPLPLTWALVVWGGHNVVLENCDLDITITNWAAQFKDQTGTLWIHDVHFGGASLSGGVQLQEPGATVVMRDVLFDTVYGSYQTNHAECLQSWSGPARLLIDGLTCSTTYQGLFLLPNQFDSATQETVWDLRNVDVEATGAYAMWLGDVQPSNLGSIPGWNLQNVYVSGAGEPRDYDGTSDLGVAWNAVIPGLPPGGSFVRRSPDGAAGPDEGVSLPALAGEQPATGS